MVREAREEHGYEMLRKSLTVEGIDELERVQKIEKFNKTEIAERFDEMKRIEKVENTGRTERLRKTSKTERKEKNERKKRRERKLKADKFEKTEATEKSEYSEFQRLEMGVDDENLWEGIDLVNFVESDEEGSGGSDSCPSEKLEEIPVTYPTKRKKKNFHKNIQEIEEFYKTDSKPEYTQSNIDSHRESKEEKLKKTYSLKPKFRVIQSRKTHSKEDSSKIFSTSPISSNLPSQNILFNYPLPYSIPRIDEKTPEYLAKLQRNLSRKKSTFLKGPEMDEIMSGGVNSMTRVHNNLNYSFERQNYRKVNREMPSVGVFTNPTIQEYSWASANKPSYIAKNFADSARYRIDKLYSKFGL